jgi:hypothetical protein
VRGSFKRRCGVTEGWGWGVQGAAAIRSRQSGDPALEALTRPLSLAFAYLHRQKGPVERFLIALCSLHAKVQTRANRTVVYGVLLPAPKPQRSLPTSLPIISRSLSRIGGFAARHSSTPALATSQCRPQQQKPQTPGVPRQVQEVRGRPNISQKRMLRK